MLSFELSLKELKIIINCMSVADDEFGPLDDKEFYKLLRKLRKIEKSNDLIKVKKG